MEWSYKCIFIWGSILLGLRTTHQSGNVATRGIATQSAESASAVGGPNAAVDKVRQPTSFEDTCTSVPLQDNPWWQVDLRGIYHITAVTVISIRDCCPEQLNGAEIRIGLGNDTSNRRCAVIAVEGGKREYNFQCEIMEGRFVHIVLPGQGKTLTVCEVMVYGTILENVALRGVASQSSRRWKTAGKASAVIDGNRITTCSITEDKPSQWVKVDLLAPYNVKIIQLAFIEDCCYTEEVWVDNTRCEVMSSSSQSLVTMDCGGIVGRLVTVMHPDVPMTLCEVEVYSTWKHPKNTFPQRPPPHSYCSSDSCSRDLILIRDEPKTWFEAQTYCRKNYFDLVTIKNAQDMNRVTDFKEKGVYNSWIGLHQDVVTWRWSLSDEHYYGHGEAEFRNWDAGEPNSKTDIQHCTGIQHTGEWRDLDCGLLNFFLCFDGRNDASQTKILVKTPMKWADAQRYCRQNHTDLLSVRNLAENQEIQSVVPAGKLAWVGLFGDSWKWSDGSDSLFRYWGQGQPDSQGPNCAYVHDRAWGVRSCNTKSMFLCYYFKKRYHVRISADADMSDPLIQSQIIKQLEAEMKSKGLSDVKIRWKMSGGQVQRKEDNKSRVCAKDGGEI